MRKTTRESLIVFTRYPEPGKTKTRLIPVLGAEGAAELQRRMTLHTLTIAEQLMHCRPVSVEVHFEGANEGLMREMFGANVRHIPQCKGDLGERMLRSFRRAFRRGVRKTIIVGTDCPGISVKQIEQALDELEHGQLILGPANDGGYYLIGLRKAIPQLFRDIPWGTGEVLKRTLEIAEDKMLWTALLEPLGDVDRPEDLPIWEKVAGQISDRRNVPCISVVIPALNEAGNIIKTLGSVQHAFGVDTIVVDGGSTDETIQRAEACGVKVIGSPPGRARQMNTGAAEARGDILLFLHADTLLPWGYDHHIRRALACSDTVAGAFRLRIDDDALGLRAIERLTNWRSRRVQMPYGDQGIFIRAERFHAMGGFPEIPIMEDFALIRRLRRQGRIVTVPVPVRTSSRRWRSLGMVRTTLINQAMIVGYLAGIPPLRLARWYRDRRHET